jgi:hypothetical protein
VSHGDGLRMRRGGMERKRVARPGDVVTADRWCWAASVAMKEGTRRGAGSAPAGGWKQGKATGERTCPGE